MSDALRLRGFMFRAEIIPADLINLTREGEERDNIEEGHKSQHDVAECPDRRQREDRTDKVHSYKSQAVPEYRVEPEQVLRGAVAVVAPADRGGNSKQKHCKRYNISPAGKHGLKAYFERLARQGR